MATSSLKYSRRSLVNHSHLYVLAQKDTATLNGSLTSRTKRPSVELDNTVGSKTRGHSWSAHQSKLLVDPSGRSNLFLPYPQCYRWNWRVGLRKRVRLRMFQSGDFFLHGFATPGWEIPSGSPSSPIWGNHCITKHGTRAKDRCPVGKQSPSQCHMVSLIPTSFFPGSVISVSLSVLLSSLGKLVNVDTITNIVLYLRQS